MYSLAPPLGELAAKPTERVKQALSAPLGHLSHRERQATFPLKNGFRNDSVIRQ